MHEQIFGVNVEHRGRGAWRCGLGEGSQMRGEYGCGGRGDKGFGRGFGFGRHGGFGRGFGGGRERLFDAGDVRLAILKLLSEEPSYGYQLMKTMEQRLAGGYTPSAGVIYPTLTQLEEEGLVCVAASENNKKVYSLTPEGFTCLDANKERIAELFERLEQAGEGFRRGRSPEIMKAFMNLRDAVAVRVSRQSTTQEQVRKIIDVINAASKTIDEL